MEWREKKVSKDLLMDVVFKYALDCCSRDYVKYDLIQMIKDAGFDVPMKKVYHEDIDHTEEYEDIDKLLKDYSISID